MKNQMQDTQAKHRVVTFLTREEIDFLDKLGKDALFASGFKISRTRVIEELVELLSKTQLNCQMVKTDQELEQVILEAMKGLYERYKESKQP